MSALHPVGEPAELAALYLTGAMTREQHEAFERHLDEGCRACSEEVRQLASVAAHLYAEVEPVQVDANIRTRLMHQVSQEQDSGNTHEHDRPNPQVWKSWPADNESEDLVIRDALNSGWEPTGIDGITIRRLSLDRARNQFTALVRMKAGTSYPSHRHRGAEECLVLEGTLRAGNRLFRAGDYQRMAEGTDHGIQSTQDGCLLLIISSLHDDMN